MVVYLGRCPRLYTVALSARVGYSYVVPIIMVEPVWAVPKFLVVGNTHGVACGKSAGCSCNRGSRPLRFPEPSLERKGRSFVRPGWLLYQLIAVAQSPSNGFSCCRVTLQAARAVSATVQSLGQRPRYAPYADNARCRRKSSRRRYPSRRYRDHGTAC